MPCHHLQEALVNYSIVVLMTPTLTAQDVRVMMDSFFHRLAKKTRLFLVALLGSLWTLRIRLDRVCRATVMCFVVLTRSLLCHHHHHYNRHQQYEEQLQHNDDSESMKQPSNFQQRRKQHAVRPTTLANAHINNNHDYYNHDYYSNNVPSVATARTKGAKDASVDIAASSHPPELSLDHYDDNMHYFRTRERFIARKYQRYTLNEKHRRRALIMANRQSAETMATTTP